VNSTITLGRVWGVPIGLHWSMIFVFSLLAFSLAAGYLPDAYPELSTGGAWLIALLTAGLFFGSILLHELGHVKVALRNGLEVKDVRLWIFGGIATMEGQPKSAGIEFRVAAAGPLVSLVLAVLFLVVFLLFGSVAALAAPAEWLLRINLALLVFNLLPGFPLDGGRILRALLWRRSGSLERATRLAASSGQILALGLMALGAVIALQGDLASGIWMGVIGWFLQNAALTESTGVTLEAHLKGVRVENAMSHEVPRVSSRLSLRLLVDQHLLATGQRIFVVADDERPRGLIGLRDIVTVPEERRDWVTVSDVMTPWSRVTAFSPDTPLLTALQQLEDANANQAPVVANDQVVGMLGREQILRYLGMKRELARGQ
jgi:Zn-dependent protease/CBS domain-containing protein